MTELAGVMVGNYFLLECLSREGIVETYRARPTTTGGYDVLLRLFQPQFPDATAFREHFPSEVEKLWRCRHTHILPLLEFGTGDDLLYTATLAMEAETLQERLERQGNHVLPIGLVLRLLTQLCAAVHHAHRHGIVHGNIQPSSVFLHNGEDALLTNFGMKRAYQDGEALAAHLEGGHPAYAAPEQGLGIVHPASDIYALGVLIYYLLGGVLPYNGSSEEEIMLKHASEPIPSLLALRPSLPDSVEMVVRGALARVPEARFSSANALAQALLEAFSTMGLQTVLTQPERRVPVQARRTKLTWARAISLMA